mmetsp:Transcript_14040/g.49435  ORF Transcript_14040/g.49435 Transcript_14040/m.49435 type:complete len:289 (-) Transcript_14040:3518-4384(-)
MERQASALQGAGSKAHGLLGTSSSREPRLGIFGVAAHRKRRQGRVRWPQMCRRCSRCVSNSRQSCKCRSTKCWRSGRTKRYSLPTSKHRTWFGSSPQARGCRPEVLEASRTPVCGGSIATSRKAFEPFERPKGNLPLRPLRSCSAVTVTVPRQSAFLRKSWSMTVKTRVSFESKSKPVVKPHAGFALFSYVGVTSCKWGLLTTSQMQKGSACPAPKPQSASRKPVAPRMCTLVCGNFTSGGVTVTLRKALTPRPAASSSNSPSKPAQTWSPDSVTWPSTSSLLWTSLS